jgi:hypothetical protein
VQHALLPQVSVSANWYRVNFYNIQTDVYSMTSAFNPITNNVLRTRGDYTPAQIVSPLDGSIVTVYNVAREKVSQVRDVIINDPDHQRWNDAFDASVNMRLWRQVTLFEDMRRNDRSMWRAEICTRAPIRTACSIATCATAHSVAAPVQGRRSFQAPRASGQRGLSEFAKVGSHGHQQRRLAITPMTRYPADCRGPCTPGALVNPGQTIPTMNVPLEARSRASGSDEPAGSQLREVDHGRRVRFLPTLAIFNTLNAFPC